LHRFVTDCADYEFVIHRNEDTLDNTDENLLVTQYNGSGVTSQHNPGQPGVYYDDVMGKWYIVVEVRRGKTRRVERWYDSITEAEADFKLATEYCKKYTYY
jgi:hypothetical protein